YAPPHEAESRVAVRHAAPRPPHPGLPAAVPPSPFRGGRSNTDGQPADRTPLTWLALTPVTGRTHQLRVHCAASGWPIVGDNIYGTAQRFTGPPQLLHAREVVVPISKNKAPVRVTAQVPTHMRDWLRACGWNRETPETQSLVAIMRSGAVRSCSGPPIAPLLMAAKIAPDVGRVLRSICAAGSHSLERTIALAHWK